MTIPSNNSTIIAQFAGALYDLSIDDATLQTILSDVNAQGMDAFLNATYAYQFGSLSTASVAQTIATNLGLTGTALAEAETYVTSVLDATAPNARGAAVEGILNQFDALTGDAVFGAAATAWSALVAQSVSYSESASSSGNISLQQLAGLPATATYTLTTGTDHIVVSSNNAVIDGTSFSGNSQAPSGVQPTFNAGDTISGGGTTGDTLNLTDLASGGYWNPSAIPNATVSGIQNLNLVSGEAVVFAPLASSMGFSGLAGVNVTSVSNGFFDDIMVGPSTAVVVNDQSQAGLGSTPYGAYSMIISGGSTVAITEANGNGYGNSQHSILVSGGSGTTQVSVTQTETSSGHMQGVVIDDNNGTIQSVSINGLDAVTWNAVVYYGLGSGSGYGYGYGYGSSVRQFYGGDLKIKNAGALKHLIIDNMANGAYAQLQGVSSLTDLTLENVTGGATVDLYDINGQATALNLTLNAVSGVISIYDQVGIYKTLNVSTTGDAALSFVNDPSVPYSSLHALNVSGSGMLSLVQPLQDPVYLAQVTVTGTAGLNADLSNAGSGTTTVDASQSSGAITLWLDGTQQQVFMGGTGTDIITLNGSANEAITGGSGHSDEVVLNYAFSGALSAQTASLISGFETLGVTGALGAGSQTIDLSYFTKDNLSTLDVQGGVASASLAFTQVAAGTVLQVDAGDAGAITYQLGDASGATDSMTVSLGTAGANGGAVTQALSLQDSGLNGIGSVTMESLGQAGYSQTVGQFNDVGLTQLSLAGTQSLVLNTLVDDASSLSVTDNVDGNSAIHTLTAPNLTAATFAQSGAGLLTVGDAKDAGTQLANLNLNGSVAFAMSADMVTSGVTVNGSNDNQAVSLVLLAGASAGHTDSITLGNGANHITDDSVQGQVNIVVGTGANQIVLTGAGVSGTITLGAHAGNTVDTITVGATGYTGNAANLMIAGFNPNAADQLVLAADPHAAAAVTTIAASSVGTYATSNGLDIGQLATWVNYALASGGLDLATHATASFQFQGNTYLVEQAATAGTAFGSGDTLIGLTGLATPTQL